MSKNQILSTRSPLLKNNQNKKNYLFLNKTNNKHNNNMNTNIYNEDISNPQDKNKKLYNNNNNINNNNELNKLYHDKLINKKKSKRFIDRLGELEYINNLNINETMKKYTRNKYINNLHHSWGKYNMKKINVNKRDKILLYGSSIWSTLINAPMWQTLLLMCLIYVTIIIGFAIVFYVMAQRDECNMDIEVFLDAYYFSIETMTTIGFGASDYYFGQCTGPAITLTVQAIMSSLFDGFCVGVLFQRWSRAQRRVLTVLFSKKATIRRINGQLHFMFQVTELRKHQLIEAHVRVYCIRNEKLPNGEGIAYFQQYPLRLSHPDDELGGMLLMALPSAVVHKMDAFSPMLPSLTNVSPLAQKHGRDYYPSKYSFPNLMLRSDDLRGPDPEGYGGIHPRDTLRMHRNALIGDEWEDNNRENNNIIESHDILLNDNNNIEINNNDIIKNNNIEINKNNNLNIDEIDEDDILDVNENDNLVNKDDEEKKENDNYNNLNNNKNNLLYNNKYSNNNSFNDDEEKSNYDKLNDKEYWRLLHEREKKLIQSFMKDRNMELIVLVEGIDGITSDTAQARHSYNFYDIVWDHKFKPCMFPNDDEDTGGVLIDMEKFHEIIPAEPTFHVEEQDFDEEELKDHQFFKKSMKYSDLWRESQGKIPPTPYS